MKKRGNRWSMLSAGLLTELLAGTSYGFGSFSDAMKTSLGLKQLHLNLISSLGNVGQYVGIFGGLFYDRFGPRLTVAGGALMASLGYGISYLGTTSVIGAGAWTSTTPKVVFFAGLFMLSFQGSAWLDSAAVTANLTNFPQNRGQTTGLLKSFFGLSGSVVAQVAASFFLSSDVKKNAPIPILLFLAAFVLIPALPLLLMMVVRPEGKLVASGQRRMGIGYLVVLAIAIFLAAVSVIRIKWDDPPTQHQQRIAQYCTGVVGVLIALLALLPVGTGCCIPRDGNEDGEMHNPSHYERVSEEPIDTDYIDDFEDNIFEPLNTMKVQAPTNCLEDLHVGQVVQRLDFWLLWFGMFVGTGTGLMCINNCAQIVEAVDATAQSGIYVTVIGSSNCVGRMLAGFVSDRLSGIPRPYFFVMSLCLMAISQVVLAFADLNLLYVGISLMGLSYGCFWCLAPTMVSELFGFSNLGAIYNAMNMAPALGSTAFSVGLAASVFNAHASADEKCYGKGCFQATFIICAGACLLGALACVVLSARTRKFYWKLNAR